MKRVLVFVTLLMIMRMGYGQSGGLDLTFGVGGKVVTNLGGGGLAGYVLQQDGKFVSIGSSMYGEITLVRYNTNGSIDSTYGTNGIAGADFPQQIGVISKGIQPDGKVLVGGNVYLTSMSDIAIARFNTNGSLDSTFGNNGLGVFSYYSSANSYEETTSMIFVRPNGKIIIFGKTSVFPTIRSYSLTQLNVNGSIDSSFGINGQVLLAATYATPGSALLLNNGKILIAGSFFDLGSSNKTCSVQRFNENGTRDLSFSSSLIFFQYLEPLCMEIQPDGKILVGGDSTSGSSNSSFRIARFDSSGNLDSTFGRNGIKNLLTIGEHNYIYNIGLQPSGKILVGGMYNNDFALLRLHPNGAVDSTFGRRGLVTTDFDAYYSVPISMLIQSDKKIVLAGGMAKNSFNDTFQLALARYDSQQLIYYNTLFINTFLDKNANGVRDINEPFFKDVNISTTKQNADNIINETSSGKFFLDIDSGNYVTTAVPYLPYYNIYPSFHATSHTTYFNVDSISFAVQAIAGKRDLEIKMVSLANARPGFPVLYKLICTNKGTDTIANGTIELVHDSRLTFNSSVPAIASLNNDTLKWAFTNLKPLDTTIIVTHFTVKQPPLVNIGDTIHLHATIYPYTSDLTPEDNTTSLTQAIRNSVDPNDKTESHGGSITKSRVDNGEYLQYTIRFQNTGNDTAFNVYLRDTLDTKLDWSSFRMLDASHNYQLTINENNKYFWKMSNINLPDSNINEPLSHGYITYVVKAKPSVQVGDVMSNKAAIYFDYNLPVFTNTEKTTVVADALPLKLLSFTAKQLAKGNRQWAVHLNWTTTNEVNVDRFEVERSFDGREFQRIKNVKCKMQNGTRNDYNYDDVLNEKPETGNVFYRLKIVDKDGRYEYSPVRMVNKVGSFSVSIYPNPVKDQLQVQVTSDWKLMLQVQVVSQDGKVVMADTWNVQEGTTTQKLNVSALQSGSYILKVASLNPPSGGREAVKFEKL